MTQLYQCHTPPLSLLRGAMEKISLQSTSGKPIRCKAAICRKAGEALVVEEVEVAPPKAYEVRIKILCTSLCHTDLTFWKMEPPIGVFPVILGHESFGVVESVGEHVEEVKEGDKVIPVFHPNCEECADCKSENSNMCTKFPFIPVGMPRDGTSRFTDSNENVVHNFFRVSTFVEYTVADITHVVKMSPDITPDMGCLFSCGVATGIGAAWKVANVQRGSTVAIFGLGVVGLAVAQGARLRGASRIIGIDLNSEKFEIGKKFGVTDFINPKDCEERPVNEVIKEMTNGGADFCFECVGLASLMKEAFDSCRWGWGKTIILGVEMHGAPLTVNSYEILQGKSMIGCLFGGLKAKSDIPLLAKGYLDKDIHLDGIVTHEIGFDDINEAFNLLLEGKSLRCIIWMDK